VAALLAACGSSNKCKKACKRIAECYGDAGSSAPPCTLSAECSAAEECQAGCIENASCGAITGTDQPGQQAMQGCIAQCGATPPPADKGVILPEGSVPLDGPTLSDLPIWPDQSVPSPDTTPGGPPVGKFCNNVLLDGNNFTATLKLGTSTTFTAYSGECDPVVNVPCKLIPPGSNISVEVTDGTQVLASGTISAINQGEEWLILFTIDTTTNQAVLQGGPFNPGNKCSTTDPFSP
jgi:hypothetical protein